ncbi:MAG: ImpA family metalloprotease [Bacilli bacterium]
MKKKIFLALLCFIAVLVVIIKVSGNKSDIYNSDNLLKLIQNNNLDGFKDYENNVGEIDYNYVMNYTIIKDADKILSYLLNKDITIKLIDDISNDTAIEIAIKNDSKKCFDILYNKGYLYGNKLIYNSLKISNKYYLKKLLDKNVEIDSFAFELIKNNSSYKDELYKYLSNDSQSILNEKLGINDSTDNTNNSSENSNNSTSNNNNTSENNSTNTDNSSESSNSNNNVSTEDDTNSTDNDSTEDDTNSTDNDSTEDDTNSTDNDSTEDDANSTDDDLTEPEEIPDIVYFTITNEPNTLTKSKEIYSYIPNAEILVEDTEIEYYISNKPNFLNFNYSTGRLYGTPDYDDIGSYENIIITAKSNEQTIHISFNLKIDQSNIEDAIENEDASNISYTEIIDFTNYSTAKIQNKCISTLNSVYGDNYNEIALDESSYWVTYLYSVNENHIPVLSRGNVSYGYFGEFENSSYFVSGVNLFDAAIYNSTDFYNSSLSEEIVYTLTGDFNFFMSGKTIYIDTKNVRKSDVIDYLNKKGITYNINFTTSSSDLENGNFDLIFYTEPTEYIINKAKEYNKPIIALYNRNRYWNSGTYTMFDIESGWYGTSTVNQFDSIESQCSTFINQSSDINKMIDILINNKLELTNISSACTTSVSKTSCDFDKLLDVSGETLSSLLTNKLENYSEIINFNDNKNINIFDTNQTVLKTMLLLADKFRSEVVFPMNHKTTNSSTFYRAYFADNLVNYARDTNEAQNDLGNFGSNLDVINTYDLETATIKLTPYSNSEVQTTGYYVKPGQKITIKRTDDSSTTTSIRFNFQRNGSSRIWDSGSSYSRPFNITSSSFEIKSGSEYEFSTPHGGNIYIITGAKADNIEIEIEISNVLSYPTLTDFSDESIEEYINSLKTTPFNFTDIDTPYASIHSLTKYMISSLAEYNNDASAYLNDIKEYLIYENYRQAGYENEDLGLLNENISSYFISNNLLDYNSSTINTLPTRQHINADVKSACGNLCSGNPFDTDSPIIPTDWGENHEMGHNLQTGLLKIYDGRSSEVSNNIFPYNVWIKAAINNNQKIFKYERLKYDKTLFEQALSEFLAGTKASINHRIWTESGTYDNESKRLQVYIQIVYATGDYDVFTKMYITSRLFNYYKENSSLWSTNKDNLGFSSYSTDDAKKISSNDFMAITASKIADRDLSAFFEGFGVSVSDTAKNQIKLNNPTNEALLSGMFYTEFVNSSTYAVSIDLPTMDDYIVFSETAVWAKP